jgi:hypothetical protein
VTFPIDDTFTDEGASEACGFDQDGNVVREIDTLRRTHV